VKETIEEFGSVIQQFSAKLMKISETEGAQRRGAEKWSKKEILGHLIDSASNNHQRFVRGQQTAELRTPGYEQQFWVSSQRYQSEPWENLVQLWKSYNLHLLHVVSAVPASALSHRCIIGEDKPETLEFVIKDYVRHLKHHLDQIFQ